MVVAVLQGLVLVHGKIHSKKVVCFFLFGISRS
jgi:hypothetical protein